MPVPAALRIPHVDLASLEVQSFDAQHQPFQKGLLMLRRPTSFLAEHVMHEGDRDRAFEAEPRHREISHPAWLAAGRPNMQVVDCDAQPPR